MKEAEPLYFAVWRWPLYYALDVYPDEIERHRRDLERSGEHVSGPYKTASEAMAAARAGVLQRYLQ